MTVYRYHQQFQCDTNTVVTWGNMDGVHRGHQYLIAKNVEMAREYQLQSMVIIFEPITITRFVKNPIVALSDLSVRVRKINDLGVDRVLIVPFNPMFYEHSHQWFVDDFLIKKCRAKRIVIGDDAVFGAKKAGNVAYLHERFYPGECALEVVAPLLDSDKIRISSFFIRRLWDGMACERVLELLGSPIQITLRVGLSKQVGESKYEAQGVVAKKWWHTLRPGLYTVRICDEASVCDVTLRTDLSENSTLLWAISSGFPIKKDKLTVDIMAVKTRKLIR